LKAIFQYMFNHVKDVSIQLISVLFSERQNVQTGQILMWWKIILLLLLFL